MSNPPNESKTPRTDAAVEEILRCADGAMDLQRFARQLELELTTLQNDVRRLVEKFDELIEESANFKREHGGDAEEWFAYSECARMTREMFKIETNNPSLKPE